MSLLWVKAAFPKKDRSELFDQIDAHKDNLHELAGIRHDSPDLGEDADFDDAFEHAGQCKTRACYPRFHLLDLHSPNLRANEPTINHEHVKHLIDTRNKSMPEVLKLHGDYHILDGHHRILQSKLMGHKTRAVMLHDGDAYLNSPASMHNMK